MRFNVPIASKTDSIPHRSKRSFPGRFSSMLFLVVLFAVLMTSARASEPVLRTIRTPSEVFTEQADSPILRPVEFPEQEELIIRGQSPRIISQIIPLVQQIYPSRLWEIGDEVLSLGNNLVSGGLRRRAGRFRSDYAYDSDGLKRLGGNLMLSSALPVAIDSEFFYREIPAATGDINELWNGDLNVIYKINAHPRYKLRTGAGVNWRTDDGSTIEVGFNTTYALEFMIRGPWMASASVDWGKLEDDSLFRWRATAGLLMGSWEVFAGYEDYKAGDDRFNGFLAGAGFWF